MLSITAIALSIVALSAEQAYAQSPRVLTFKNSCGNAVFLSPVSGSAGDCSSCPQGSTCNTANNICFWDTPTPSAGNWKVEAGATSTVSLPFFDNGVGIYWSGNFAFCEEGTSCLAADDVCTSQGCAAPVGGKVEFTFSKTDVDFYDVSNIHGVNVPVSFTPDVITKTDGNPYGCANVGAVTPQTGLGASSWKFSPPDDKYVWVSNGSGNSCSATSDCPSGETCGTKYADNVLSRACGVVSGYWSANQACVLQGDSEIFECAKQEVNGGITGTYAELQRCDGATSGSCYQPGADTECCGCVNWTDLLGSSKVPGETKSCVNSSPVWTSEILPTLKFLKDGAPNAYTYPFDDMSSTGTCANYDSNGVNTLGYTIELCPGGTDLLGSSSTTAPAEDAAPVESSSTSSASGSSSTGSSSSSGGDGTCSGVAFDTSSEVCDNGHVCPSGQHFCTDSCYDPATSCCSDGKISTSAELCFCSGAGFTGTQYTCSTARTLCPAGNYACGSACYDPASYGCCNGGLTAAGQDC